MWRLVKVVCLTLLVVVALTVGGTASADPTTCKATSNPLACACGSGGGAKSSTACSTKTGDPISGPNGALKKVALTLSIIAGVAAVVIIIVAGLQYVTAGGDSQKITGARNAIIGAVIGLVVIVAAGSIITFVLSKL